MTHQDGCLLSYDAYGAQQFYFPNILKYDPDQFSLRMENVADIHELMSEPTGNHTLNVIGYVPGTNFGGGQFYWDASKPKSQHNGITIFSPTVPRDGSYAGLSAFLAGTGVNDSTASVNACINKFGIARPIRISPGALKISFPTTYQYHDLFNVARKTAFVINAKNNLTIFAENDVNINTDDGGESERVCFGVIGCSNFSFSGLNSIRHAQTFRPGQQTQLSSRRKFGSVSHARVQADT